MLNQGINSAVVTNTSVTVTYRRQQFISLFCNYPRISSAECYGGCIVRDPDSFSNALLLSHGLEQLPQLLPPCSHSIQQKGERQNGKNIPFLAKNMIWKYLFNFVQVLQGRTRKLYVSLLLRSYRAEPRHVAILSCKEDWKIQSFVWLSFSQLKVVLLQMGKTDTWGTASSL